MPSPSPPPLLSGAVSPNTATATSSQPRNSATAGQSRSPRGQLAGVLCSAAPRVLSPPALRVDTSTHVVGAIAPLFNLPSPPKRPPPIPKTTQQSHSLIPPPRRSPPPKPLTHLSVSVEGEQEQEQVRVLPVVGVRPKTRSPRHRIDSPRNKPPPPPPAATANTFVSQQPQLGRLTRFGGITTMQAERKLANSHAARQQAIQDLEATAAECRKRLEQEAEQQKQLEVQQQMLTAEMAAFAQRVALVAHQQREEVEEARRPRSSTYPLPPPPRTPKAAAPTNGVPPPPPPPRFGFYPYLHLRKDQPPQFPPPPPPDLQVPPSEVFDDGRDAHPLLDLITSPVANTGSITHQRFFPPPPPAPLQVETSASFPPSPPRAPALSWPPPPPPLARSSWPPPPPPILPNDAIEPSSPNAHVLSSFPPPPPPMPAACKSWPPPPPPLGQSINLSSPPTGYVNLTSPPAAPVLVSAQARRSLERIRANSERTIGTTSSPTPATLKGMAKRQTWPGLNKVVLPAHVMHVDVSPGWKSTLRAFYSDPGTELQRSPPPLTAIRKVLSSLSSATTSLEAVDSPSPITSPPWSDANDAEELQLQLLVQEIFRVHARESRSQERKRNPSAAEPWIQVHFGALCMPPSAPTSVGSVASLSHSVLSELLFAAKRRKIVTYEGPKMLLPGKHDKLVITLLQPEWKSHKAATDAAATSSAASYSKSCRICRQPIQAQSHCEVGTHSYCTRCYVSVVQQSQL